MPSRSWPRPPALRLPCWAARGALLPTAAGAAVAESLAALLSVHPGTARPVLAAVATGVLLAVTLSRGAEAAILLTLCFLPGLALFRRLLIPAAGWSSYDPLLLVGPLIAAVVALMPLVRRDARLAPDALSRAVLGFLALVLVETLNPSAASIPENLVSLLFLGAPLLWFFIGRDSASPRLILRISWVWLGMAAAVAIDGLVQTYIGMPPWDERWIASDGYASLGVGTAIRAFGSFSSGAEYATFLGIGIVIALAHALRGRPAVALVIPLLATALFVESSRSFLVLTVVAAVVMLGLRSGRPSRAVAMSVAAAAVLVAATAVLGRGVEEAALGSDDSLVSHQLGGLTEPLNPERSTLSVHAWEVYQGIVTGLTHPVGSGSGATTMVGSPLTSAQAGTEFDLSNALVGEGLLGGALFLVITVLALSRGARLALRASDPLPLIAAGSLVVAFGQWLTGGYYAVGPMLWLLIGWMAREWRARRSPGGARGGG